MNFPLRTVKQLSATCIFIITSLPVWAPDNLYADDFTKRFYLNGGFGTSRLDPESSNDALTISDRTDVGGHLALGYDITRLLTVEAYVAALGSARVEFLGTDAGSVQYTVFGLSAIGYLINSRSGIFLGDDDQTGLFRREGLSLYGRVGLGGMDNDSNRVDFERDNDIHAAFGVGMEYGFPNGVAVRTELMAFDTDARYFNVGVVKRFGDVRPVTALAAALPVVAEKEVAPAVDAAADTAVLEPVQPLNLYFESNVSDLTPEATARLDAFAEQVEDSDIDLQVEGHTDWLAKEAYNQSLSVRRAEAVANYLVSKGIDRDRLSTIGYGELRPISNNDTEEGRALNRRSEIIPR